MPGGVRSWPWGYSLFHQATKPGLNMTWQLLWQMAGVVRTAKWIPGRPIFPSLMFHIIRTSQAIAPFMARYGQANSVCVCLFHLPANGIAMRCRRFMKNTVPLQELAETHNNGPALSGFPQQKSQGFQWTYASYAVFSCMEMHTFSTSQQQMVSLLQVVWDLSRCWRFQSPQRVTGDHLPNRNGHHGHHMTIKKG